MTTNSNEKLVAWIVFRACVARQPAKDFSIKTQQRASRFADRGPKIRGPSPISGFTMLHHTTLLVSPLLHQNQVRTFMLPCISLFKKKQSIRVVLRVKGDKVQQSEKEGAVELWLKFFVSTLPQISPRGFAAFWWAFSSERNKDMTTRSISSIMVLFPALCAQHYGGASFL